MSDPLRALQVATGQEITTSASDLPNIPAVPASADQSVVNWMNSVKSWLDTAAGQGLTGFASKQDLIDAGVLKVTQDGTVVPTLPTSSMIPPAPKNLAAYSALQNIILQWDDPTASYPNHAYAEIWASGTNNFTDAVMVGQSPSFMFAHTVGDGATRYYWVRFISTSGVKGPFDDVSGTPGENASIDPAAVFAAIVGTAADQPFFTLTEPTVLNGVTVPAGTYLKEAFIAAATISNAMIRNAAIDAAKIADAAIVNAKIADLAVTNAKISGIIQSSTYIPTVSGWMINKEGDVEFNNGKFNGIVSAASVEAALGSATYYEYSTPGTYTLNIPSGLNFDTIRIRITGASGGGGGGGGAFTDNSGGGAGGAGGAGGSGVDISYDVTYASKAGGSLQITVGAAGAAGGGGSAAIYSSPSGGGRTAPGGASGTAGGASSVTGIGSAAGGAGGAGGGGGWWGDIGGSMAYGNGAAGAVGGNGAGGGGGAGGVYSAPAQTNGWHYGATSGSGGAPGIAGRVRVTLFKGNTLVKEVSYQALISWLDTIGHGSVPAAAR